MNKINFFLFTAAAILFVSVAHSQLTCQSAVTLDYTGPEPQLVPTFTTIGVPNDNATSGATACVTAVGTGGQHWYRLQLSNQEPVSVTVTTDLPGTNFDTKLHVYTGSCGSLVCVAGDDDSGTGTTSLLSFVAQPGTEYLIRAGGFNNLSGNIALNVNAGVPGCTDIFAGNFNPSATWDDGSCCTNGYITLGSNAPSGASAQVYVNEVLVATATAGQTVWFCDFPTCNVYAFFYSWDPWNSVSYEMVFGSEYHSGTLNGYFYGNVPMVPSYCGCMDPAAENYNPAATEDMSNCYYVSNVDCQSAIELIPDEFVQVDTQSVPANLTASNCVIGKQVLWYKFTYNGGTVRLSAPQNEIDSYMGVFADCAGESMICIDDPYYYNQSTGVYYWPLNVRATLGCDDGLVKGETYYVGIGLLSGEGTFLFQYELFDNPGCTNPAAPNYDACANIDDGSCDTCPADLDNSGVVNVTDLLQFVAAYGSACN